MACNVFIIHGAYGRPDENWFPWLKGELEKLDCRVFIPKFPTPEKQTMKKWLKAFENYGKYLNEDSIVVGHSLGYAFILNLLENKKIRAAFLVAAYYKFIGNDYFDTISKTFMKSFDWEKIKGNCGKFFIYHSDNDMYQPLSMAHGLTDNLNARLKIIKNAGHFNEKSGYVKFEALLHDLKRLVAKDL